MDLTPEQQPGTYVLLNSTSVRLVTSVNDAVTLAPSTLLTPSGERSTTPRSR